MAVAVTARQAELAANLDAVRARVAAAARAAGRDPADITVIAVGKTFPAEDVATLVRLGVADFGENRDQEASAKAAAVAAALPDATVRWHFVGQLQRNKTGSVAGYADVVHSLDRARLVDALGRSAEHTGRRIDALVQIDLGAPDQDDGDGPGARGGAAPDDVMALAERIAALPALRLAGVMALPPLSADPAATYTRLADLADRVRSLHPDAAVVSAGMSGDLEVAIAHGATHLRVGTALFGGRALVSDHVR